MYPQIFAVRVMSMLIAAVVCCIYMPFFHDAFMGTFGPASGHSLEVPEHDGLIDGVFKILDTYGLAGLIRVAIIPLLDLLVGILVWSFSYRVINKFLSYKVLLYCRTTYANPKLSATFAKSEPVRVIPASRSPDRTIKVALDSSNPSMKELLGIRRLLNEMSLAADAEGKAQIEERIEDVDGLIERIRSNNHTADIQLIDAWLRDIRFLEDIEEPTEPRPDEVAASVVERELEPRRSTRLIYVTDAYALRVTLRNQKAIRN